MVPRTPGQVGGGGQVVPVKDVGARRSGAGSRRHRELGLQASSWQSLSFLTFYLKPCGNGSILGSGNTPFFFICGVERLSSPENAG